MAAMKAAEGKKLLESFLREMPAELEGLRADVKKADRPQLLPLDQSYESLDRLEDFLRLVFEGRVRVDADKARERGARYFGATVAARTGGAWGLATDDAYDPLCVSGAPAAPDAEIVPALVVAEFEDSESGWLRDSAERFDIELQRRLIAATVANKSGVLAELRADIKKLTGSDPGALDGAVDSLPLLAKALVAADEESVSRELRRKVRNAATFYIGCAIEKRLGADAWSVDDEFGTSDFGRWRIFGRSPQTPVEAVAAGGDPGILTYFVEKALKPKRKS